MNSFASFEKTTLLIFLKKYGLNLGCAVLVLSLIYFFFEPSSFSWQVLLSGFLLYSLLSFITGVRFYGWLRASEQVCLHPSELISIPARMNLFSYILPFKGGGLWLMWYLKKHYQLNFSKTLGLAFQNALLALSLILELVISVYWSSGSAVEQFFRIVLTIVVLNILLWPLKRRMQQQSSLLLLFSDTLLSVLYLGIICTLPMLLLNISVSQALLFASLILTSSLVKLTPANIGVLEGMALIAGYWFDDPGFLQFVAYFRLLSLLHAATFGLGSLWFNPRKINFKQNDEQ